MAVFCLNISTLFSRVVASPRLLPLSLLAQTVCPEQTLSAPITRTKMVLWEDFGSRYTKLSLVWERARSSEMELFQGQKCIMEYFMCGGANF